MLRFSPDAETLADSVRDVLKADCGRDAVLAHAESSDAFDARLWRRAAELGWMAIMVPEHYDGLALGMEAAAAIHRELGACCAPLPFLGTTLFADVIARGSPEARCAALLPAVAAGELIGAVADPLEPPAIRMTPDGAAGLRLDGRVCLMDGAGASMVLLRVTGLDDTPGWVLVDLAADGVRAEPVRMWDPTRRSAVLTLDAVSVPRDRLLSPIDDSAVIRHAALAHAADSLGCAEAVLSMTVDYLKTRQQFGRLIGSFQALKHRCADHQAALTAAGALAAEAVADPAACAALAKALACETASEVARDAVQLHGGIGFTWDHPCHLHLKRTLLNEASGGSVAVSYDRAYDRAFEQAATRLPA